MKKLLTLTALILICLNICAQEIEKAIKTIEVIGIAEQQVIPDEIYLQITLREYKKGGQKISMSLIEKELIDLVEKLRLPTANLKVENFYGRDWHSRRRKNDDLFASKSFRLLVNSVAKLNSLTEMIDSQAIQTINISHYDYSEITKFRADLKVEAIKAAKKKADDLLMAVGEELGVAVKVTEIEEDLLPQRKLSRTEDYSNMELLKSEDKYESDIDFKTIQLKASIKVVFAIR